MPRASICASILQYPLPILFPVYPAAPVIDSLSHLALGTLTLCTQNSNIFRGAWESKTEPWNRHSENTGLFWCSSAEENESLLFENRMCLEYSMGTRFCPLKNTLIKLKQHSSFRLSSVKLKIVCVCSCPSLGCFPNFAFEIFAVLVWFTMG